jgi:hypothetical protein
MLLLLYNEIFLDCVGMEFQKGLAIGGFNFWGMEGAVLYDEDHEFTQKCDT